MSMNRSARAVVSILVVVVLAGVHWFGRVDDVDREPSPRASKASLPANSDAGFDYYLIALSWSPTYCETNPDDAEQCGKRGYGFVLHGLWPQYENGSGPQDCARGDGPDRATVERALAFMPSRRLIEHEWRAHGSCSGLPAKAYFDLADRAFGAIAIPAALSIGATSTMSRDQIRAAFLAANPALRPDMFALTCRGRDFAEARFCVGDRLQLRTCGHGVRDRCPREPLRIPLAR